MMVNAANWQRWGQEAALGCQLGFNSATKLSDSSLNHQYLGVNKRKNFMHGIDVELAQHHCEYNSGSSY